MGKKIGVAVCWFMAFAGSLSSISWFATNAAAAILSFSAAVLFCPPVWVLIRNKSGLNVPTGGIVAAAVMLLFTGSSMVAGDDKAKAAEQGFASVTDYKAASKLGLNAEAYAKRAAELSAAEKEKAEAAKALEAKKAIACRNDLQCWAAKHEIDAIVACKPKIERLAKYDFEWTDGLTSPFFVKLSWGNKTRGEVNYIGDAVKFQNGFGNFLKHKYICKFDPASKSVMMVTADPGRL